MNIPKQLKICGLDYKVEFDDNLAERETLCGQHYPNRLKIVLHKGEYHQQKIEQTFWHEIVHAISTHYCGQHELDENQVDCLSNGLYQVLKDNKLISDNILKQG